MRCPMRADARSTTRRRNAHGTNERELLYPWHPWTGRQVQVHEAMEKGGGEVFRCSLSGLASDRWLEVPSWMFDRVASATWRVCAAPHVDVSTLGALATLLQDVKSVSDAPSQLRDSRAGLLPHNTKRGDVHVAPGHNLSVRSVLQSERYRDDADAALAGTACGDTPDADEADGPSDPRSRRRRPRFGSGGDAS